MHKFLFGLVFSLSMIQTPARAIVNGADVASGSLYARSTVFIKVSEMNGCVGSIIGPRHILTAAHCTLSPNPYPVIFATDIGAVARGESPAEVRRTVRIFRHPNFRKHDLFSDDLAILELDRAVPESTQAIRLPTAELTVAPGEAVLPLGYGYRNPESLPVVGEPVRLAQREMKVVQPKEQYFKNIDLSFHRLVLDQAEGGICNRDSGGPVYLLREGKEPIQIGVNGAVWNVTGGPACAGSAYATRLDTSLEWINAVLSQGK